LRNDHSSMFFILCSALFCSTHTESMRYGPGIFSWYWVLGPSLFPFRSISWNRQLRSSQVSESHLRDLSGELRLDTRCRRKSRDRQNHESGMKADFTVSMSNYYLACLAGESSLLIISLGCSSYRYLKRCW
jgi:hypothetical protein